MTRLPEMSEEDVEQCALQIINLKTKIIHAAQKIGLREILTSTKLCQILQNAGLNVSIGELKVLLKHLGFNWNGACCSIT